MNNLRVSFSLRLWLLLLLALAFASATRAATFIVTNNADSGPGSLRQSVLDAATNVGADAIIFAPALSGTTLTLTNEIVLDTSVIIDATGLAAGFTLNGNNLSRIFRVAFETTNVLTALTLTNGTATGGFGGGGILNFGTLTLNQSTLTDNRAGCGGCGGGGIYNFGYSSLTVNQCIFTGNDSSAGGAIYNEGGELTVNQSSIKNNYASGGSGGAIFNGGTMTLNQSSITGNHMDILPFIGGAGGGIRNSGVLTVNQSTLTGNHADEGEGGGIYNGRHGILILNQSTLADNHADGGGYGYGGGIRNEGYLTFPEGIFIGGTVILFNSIVAGNSAFSGPNTFGPFFSVGVNLTSGDPLLASLGNYGGPTQTMPPLPGSPALDAGDDSVTNSFTTDQRGRPRLAGLHVDIGAVEGGYNPAGPGKIIGVTPLANGAIQFSFTNLAAMSFSVLATTNVACPASAWTDLGTAVENPAGSRRYQFTDLLATNNGQRFYRVRSP